jgi:hypothetical protein
MACQPVRRVSEVGCRSACTLAVGHVGRHRYRPTPIRPAGPEACVLVVVVAERSLARLEPLVAHVRALAFDLSVESARRIANEAHL